MWGGGGVGGVGGGLVSNRASVECSKSNLEINILQTA